MPGHAASIAIGRPDAVVDCKPDDTAPLYDGSYQSSSQLDPSNPATFTLVEHLITELVTIFPDKYLHFGGVSTHLPSVLGSCLFPLMNRVGVVCFCIANSRFCPAQDEVQVPCFCSSAKIRAFMKTKGWSTDCPTGGSGHPPGYKHLIAFFLRQVQGLAKKHGRTPCGWQEIFDRKCSRSLCVCF